MEKKCNFTTGKKKFESIGKRLPKRMKKKKRK
jgi:hypothetical protein